MSSLLGSPSRRDLALLRAVAAGRCELSRRGGLVLFVDGRCCCDQSAAHRLTREGFIALERKVASDRVPAELTPAGRALLAVA